MSEHLPSLLVYRVCVYRSPDEPDTIVAHCLETDLVGIGECVESALTELLENIDTQAEICVRTGAPFFVPAPAEVWKKYAEALRAGRVVCRELVERVVDEANKRLGHKPPTIERIVASKQVPVECLEV